MATRRRSRRGDLTKHFPVHGGNLLTNARGHYVHAVEAVSLALKPGHVIALVGESGSGKTSVGRLLARLDTPTSGEVALHGRQVTKARGRKLREYRREVQVVFQDPFASPTRCTRSHITWHARSGSITGSIAGMSRRK